MRYLSKTLILFVLMGLWLCTPCMAATSAHPASSSTQHKTPANKHVRHGAHHKSKAKSHKKVAHKRVAIPNDRTALVAEEPKIQIEAKSRFSFLKSVEQRFVDYVAQTVNSLRYSAYKLGGTRYDTSRGIYVLDCSDYVDHVLADIYPDAYSSLVDYTGSEKPTTQHYYDFFSDLDNDPRDYWSKVDDVEKLQAGDILVFRYKNKGGRNRGGHVMVVMDKPVQDENAFLVRVADSAPTGHSEDTRSGRVSGIGIGTLRLKTNPETGQPSAYAWKVGSRWNDHVKIAMARPNGTS